LGTLSPKNIDAPRWIPEIPPSSFPSIASETILLLLLFTASPLSATETPRRQNILRLARIDDVQRMDPAKQVMTADFRLGLLVHLPLLDMRDGTNLLPCAARTRSASPDLIQFQFTG
jgi:hypothetical protein